MIQFVPCGLPRLRRRDVGVENDLIPYGMAIGNRAHLAGLNIIGMRRRNFTREQIHDIRRAYRLLFADEGTLSERVEDVAGEFATHPFVHEILDFIREGKERAICMPRDPSARPLADAQGAQRRPDRDHRRGRANFPSISWSISERTGQEPYPGLSRLRSRRSCAGAPMRTWISSTSRPSCRPWKGGAAERSPWSAPCAVPGFAALLGAYSLLRNMQEVKEVIAVATIRFCGAR